MSFIANNAGSVSLASALAMTGAIAPALLSDATMGWRLRANVPVMCGVQAVVQDSADARKFTVETVCNVESYALILGQGEARPQVADARVSIGRAVINGHQIDVTGNRPGAAITDIVLADAPPPEAMAVAIIPVQ